MTVINTNIAAQVTANAMKSNQRTMETTMERLATGTRVNSAKDDSAGLAIGTKMDSQIRGFEQAVRNANDGISMLQTADGAASEITDLLQRMRELTVQGQNDTNSSTDLSNLNEEFVALATEIQRIATDTEFNGIALLNSNITKTVQIGAEKNDSIEVTMGDFRLDSGLAGTAGVDTLTIVDSDITNLGTNAASAIIITDSTGKSITINQTLIGAHGDASDFSDAEVATLVSVINTAIDLADGSGSFAGMAAAAGGGGITFTQDSAGTGSITGVSLRKANVVTSFNSALSNTTLGAGAAGTPMGADLGTYDASGTHVQTGATLDNIDVAISGVNVARANFGANISRLGHTIDNLNVAITNTASAKSSVMDADYASETTELARTQIISQAATAMLSQANQQAQSVLALLK
jgi:flagellin